MCLWDHLATVDFIWGGWSPLAPDTSGLKDGERESGLETGFWIPVVVQSIPTWILPDFPLPSVLPFLGLASSQGQDWLCRFWLPARWDSCSLFGCRPRSTLRGVISGRGAHWFSSGARVQCPSQSNADVLPEGACLVDVGRVVAAKHLWKCFQIAALAARSTGGWSTSFTCGGRVNLSSICVAAATTPRATLAAKSGVDMAPWRPEDTSSWSYTMQVWASGSHTKTSHLHCSVSISMCALGWARSLSRSKRVICWQALEGTPGISRWCHRGITSSTRRQALHFHVFIIVLIVVSLLKGILAKPWVTIDVIRMEDGRALWPIQIHQALCPQSPQCSRNSLWGSTISGLTREVGIMDYNGLSFIRLRICSILATTSWYSRVYIFLDWSSVGGFPLNGKSPMNRPLW